MQWFMWFHRICLLTWTNAIEKFVRFCYQPGGIIKELFTLNNQPNDELFWCLHWIINEIEQCNWKVPNWQIEKVLHSIMILQGHIHLYPLGENYWSLAWMFSYSHHKVLILHHLITSFFRTLQNSLDDKNSNNEDDDRQS